MLPRGATGLFEAGLSGYTARMGFTRLNVGRWVAAMVAGLWVSAVTAQEAAPPPAPTAIPEVPQEQPLPPTEGAPPVNPEIPVAPTADPVPPPRIRFTASNASLASTPVSPPDPSPEPPPEPLPDPQPDHLLVGPLAFGLGSVRRPESGALQLLINANGQSSADERRSPVPTIELRGWLGAQRRVGIDLGFSYFQSTAHVGDTRVVELDAFYSRLGVPIALAILRHSTLELIPQVSYVGAGGRTEVASQALFQWDLALRLAAEIHFGFIGLPELSVQSGVGMSYTHQVLHQRTRGYIGSPLPYPLSYGNFRMAGSDIGPFGGDGPWDMFLGNLAVLYYF